MLYHLSSQLSAKSREIDSQINSRGLDYLKTDMIEDFKHIKQLTSEIIRITRLMSTPPP